MAPTSEPELGEPPYRNVRRPSGRRPPGTLARKPIPGEQVPPSVKLVLASEILITYAMMRVRMAKRGLRDLVAISRSGPAAPPPGLEPGSLEARLVAARLGNAVGRTLRILPTDSRCLVQSLVLSRLLSVRGISSTLVIGAHSNPSFAAHAWVEHEGRAVLPPGEFRESRLLEL